MRKPLFLLVALAFISLSSCKDLAEEKHADKDAKIEAGKGEEGIEGTAKKDSTGIILFFGNSLTAGYGLETAQAFPALIQQKIDSLNLPYKARNAGLSGETTAAGKARISWVLQENVEVFILELGANDGLRGISLNETRKNLQAIMDTVTKKNPETRIVLAGMQLPPNIGQEYTSEFKDIFPELAEKNKVALIPFLLKDVGGIPELNQQDGIHPTAEGQKILANNVWEVLGPILKKK